ncbi:terpenoid synthase [Guyanagaster necrorhizus]|uniref:Terpenoid synthase n=1 Tax=Guyanagaster necrorhizus TaxID=856835 RepID=A0A9P8ARI2_9AGAR|nr:terpenoid synthase [Guyanagaster necrorhizus MCA 3950]KAG7444921.1 terpenoid synthase [Guyanagaster necrorhizus MCA 3950]
MAPSTLSVETIRSLRESIHLLLDRCSVDLQTQRSIPFDNELFLLACKEAARQSLIVDAHVTGSFRPYIKQGADTITACFPHIQDIPSRVYMILYLASFFYLDDKFTPGYESDGENMAQELFRCVTGRTTPSDPIQKLYWFLVTEAPTFFPNSPASNIIITGSLNFITSAILDSRTQGMNIPASAKRYTTFSRDMSGFNEVFGIFIFPSSVPITAYITALPDLMVFIGCANDVLSFYKEESAGEVMNQVSLLASCDNCPKIEAVQKLVDTTVQAHRNILDTLCPNKVALHAYLSFSDGYLRAHIGISRYRLEELGFRSGLVSFDPMACM